MAQLLGDYTAGTGRAAAAVATSKNVDDDDGGGASHWTSTGYATRHRGLGDAIVTAALFLLVLYVCLHVLTWYIFGTTAIARQSTINSASNMLAMCVVASMV